MSILYKSEHNNCYDCDRSEKPLIEIVKRVKGSKDALTVACNEILFIAEGCLEYSFPEHPINKAVKGEIIFRPTAIHHSYEALTDVTAVLFRIRKPIVLCDNYPLEKLYDVQSILCDDEKPRKTDTIGHLKMNARMWHFLGGIMNCITDGLKCRHWFDLKISECLTYLRVYYPKEELHDFFALILSGDTAFSEYVRIHRYSFKTVGDMANSIHMGTKQFSRRFQKIFGQAPYSWMLEGREQKAYDEIVNTKKPFQQIAYDQGFNSDTQFTRLFKQKYGKTPTNLRKEFGERQNGKENV